MLNAWCHLPVVPWTADCRIIVHSCWRDLQCLTTEVQYYVVHLHPRFGIVNRIGDTGASLKWLLCPRRSLRSPKINIQQALNAIETFRRILRKLELSTHLYMYTTAQYTSVYAYNCTVYVCICIQLHSICLYMHTTAQYKPVYAYNCTVYICICIQLHNICIYKPGQLKSRLQHTGTWSAASGPGLGAKCFRLSLFFHHLRLTALSLPQGKIGALVNKCILFILCKSETA